MSVALTLQSKISVVETLTGPAVDPNDNTVTVNQYDETLALTASTTPPVTKQAAFEQALTAGAATIDLTALPGLTDDETVDGTGLKVQAIKFKNPSANANKITISQGASNGYQLDGATNWSVVLAPGQSVLFYLDDAADDVAGAAKEIDLAGTGAQTLEVAIVMG